MLFGVEKSSSLTIQMTQSFHCSLFYCPHFLHFPHFSHFSRSLRFPESQHVTRLLVVTYWREKNQKELLPRHQMPRLQQEILVHRAHYPLHFLPLSPSLSLNQNLNPSQNLNQSPNQNQNLNQTQIQNPSQS